MSHPFYLILWKRTTISTGLYSVFEFGWSSSREILKNDTLCISMNIAAQEIRKMCEGMVSLFSELLVRRFSYGCRTFSLCSVSRFRQKSGCSDWRYIENRHSSNETVPKNFNYMVEWNTRLRANDCGKRCCWRFSVHRLNYFQKATRTFLG